MGLTNKQQKTVNSAEDLLKRLQSEKRKRVDPEAAEVALEFRQNGPTLMRGLLTLVKQLAALVEAREATTAAAQQEVLNLTRERDILKEYLEGAQEKTAAVRLMVETNAWHEVTGLLQQMASRLFIEGKDTEAAALREAYHQACKRAERCQQREDNATRPKPSEGYIIVYSKMTKAQKAKVEGVLRCHDLMEVFRGEPVPYTVGVNAQTVLADELKLGSQLQRV